MKIDVGLPPDARLAADAAAAAETAGYDGVWTAELAHDPFLPLVPAALATRTVDVGTSIAVAFARNPMDLAYTAHDLHAVSGGRFVLGLGSQIKAHIARRFSMEWSHPAPRMREFVLALQAIWRAWDQGGKLDFEGEFYRHSLMTPAFSPPPNPTAPRVFLAGVGEVMTRVAGEVADGMFCHAFTTERYLREVTVPAVEEGLRRSGRARTDVEIAGLVFVGTGPDERTIERNVAGIRSQLAFYASTPAYRAVLELHGWGDLQPELTELTKQGRWDEMAGLVTDEILDAFAVVGPPDHVAKELPRRFGGVLDRCNFYRAEDLGETADAVVAALRRS